MADSDEGRVPRVAAHTLSRVRVRGDSQQTAVNFVNSIIRILYYTIDISNFMVYYGRK